MFKNAKLGTKIGGGFGLVLLLFLLVMGIYQHSLTGTLTQFENMTEQEVAIAAHAKTVESLMLQCRRNEKDFLIRKDLKYLQKHQANITALEEHAQSIIELAEKSGYPDVVRQANDILVYARDYGTVFQTVVAAWENKGLDHESGLQGTFRDVVHGVMDTTNEHTLDHVYLGFLSMHRDEKRYFAAPTPEHWDDFLRSRQALADMAKDQVPSETLKERLQTLLTEYVGKTDAYANLADANAVDSVTEDTDMLTARMEAAIRDLYAPRAGELALAIRRAEKDYLLRGVQKYVDKTHQAVQDFIDAFATSAVAATQVDKMRQNTKSYLEAFDALVAEDQRLATLTADMRDAVHKIEPIVEEIAAFSMDKTGQIATSARASSKKAVVLGLVTVLLGIVAAWWVTRSITKPVRRIVTGLGENAAHVASASSQVSVASQSLAEGATEQAAGLEETSSSLEEMSSMTRQNADNAQQANTLAEEARQAADSGSASMQRMNGAILDIQKSSDETAKIIKVIDDIAFQTNLLALNAAVEAARAGEAGKGFAVVAEEVRNLAMRSAEAAKNTANMIEESVNKAKNGVDIANEVGSVLEEIVQSVAKATDLVREIAAASQEQAQGIDQVNTAVSQMDKVTQQNAASAEESASASEELNAQADSMNELVDQLVDLVDGTKRSSGPGRVPQAHQPRSHNVARPAQTKRSKEHQLRRSDEPWHQITGKLATPGNSSHDPMPRDESDAPFDDFNA